MSTRLRKWEGLIAAPFTPFHKDCSLALESIPAQAHFLAHNGVSGSFICGTTGEGLSMTTAERIEVASAWRRCAPIGLRIVVHVGHQSIGESCALAEHAQRIGVDAIASIAPSFFKPPGATELVAWCQEVAAAAPKLPFYYYHMPLMTGLSITATDFIREADGKIPTLAGVKFTHEDMKDYREAAEYNEERYSVLFGRDEILLDGLEAGALSAVGSTYNYAAPLYARIIAAMGTGSIDVARIEQAKAVAFINILNSFGGLSAGKATMKLVGIDCGPVRLPLRTLSPSEERELDEALKTVGFYEYASKIP